ncbi:MAG: hypothetical protein PVF89_08610 [Lysobacterales bacterium]
MKKVILIVAFVLAPVSTWGDTLCPEGTQAACLKSGDKICSGESQCVDENAVCYAEAPCAASGGFICAAEYRAVVDENERTVKKYKELTAENVKLRVQRLEQKNCVLNAPGLEAAKRCVR